MPAPVDSATASSAIQALESLMNEAQNNQPSVPQSPSTTLATLAQMVIEGLDPQTTLVPRTQVQIELPAGYSWPGSAEGVSQLAPLTISPDFPISMGRLLASVSQEYLLPGVGKIPTNTISLLDTDRRALESYMLGANREAVRLLLWYGFPVDLGSNGSHAPTFFRLFFDVTAQAADQQAAALAQGASVNPATLYDSLYDIAPIDSWEVWNALGNNPNPQQRVSPGLFLLLRGDLLQKFQNVHVYALPAMPNPSPSAGDPQLVVDDSKTPIQPLFRNELPPDVTFYSWPFTGEQAIGSDPNDPAYPHGVFFVFQEVPGELRFGLEPGGPAPQGFPWGKVAWGNLPASTKFLSPAVAPVDPTTAASPAFQPSQAPDSGYSWGPEMDSAGMAYILLRHPSWVAFHARDMMKGLVSAPATSGTSSTGT